MFDLEKQITKPTLIVNKKICERNIQKMLAKAQKSKCILRPHFKTHQSTEIGKLFKNAGISKITVSSFSMANFFASNGWNDILVAFVFNHKEIEIAKKLNKKITIYFVVDSIETIQFIAKSFSSEIKLYIKIDTGNHRTGIDIDDTNMLEILINEIKKYSNIQLVGLLGHCGHTYFANSKEEILNIWNTVAKKMISIKNRYKLLFPNLIISLGDTPSSNLTDNFDEIDEIRPGNFVYNDLMQVWLNTCTYKDIATAVACPVVSINKNRNEIVIYGGAIHFSKEYLINRKGNKIFGIVAKIQNGFFVPYDENIFLTSLTQEHGIISCTKSFIETINIGNVVIIIPVHSCLTANQLLDSTLYV